MAKCQCWVSKLTDEERFSVRYGAHNPQCPVFRPSLDPVDALNDVGVRPKYECDCGYVGEWDGAHEKRGHSLAPLPVTGVQLICENGCEQSGCSLSDCVAWVQDSGNCPMCGGPAHLEAS